MNLSRSVINAILPEGAFWEPAADDDYDKLLNGIANNTEIVYNAMSDLSCLRCPETTTILSDLEKEYGIIPAALATESQRRSRLAAFMYRRAGNGSAELLQSKLRESGFTDVYVHVNSPAVDPNIFLAQAFNMVCGDVLGFSGNDAQCGEPDAYCSAVGGELVVNGDLFESSPNYVNLCGEDIGCGEDVLCGDFDGYKSASIDVFYEVPTDAGYWPLIFFVGGPATRDINGYITNIDFYVLPTERRLEFRRIILRFKPMHSWGGLIVIYN